MGFQKFKKEKKTEGEQEAGKPGGRGEGAGKPPFMGGWEHMAARGSEEDDAPSRESSKNTRTIQAGKEPITIENYCSAEKLEKLKIDDGICMFSRHKPERQKASLVAVSRIAGGNVISCTTEDLLVAYIGIHHPSKRERWGKPEYSWLYELGAIEVSRNYRKLGLAENMLDVAFDDPFYDDKIVLTTGFTWHWDLEGTGMNKMEYRNLGINLFGRYGFMEMATDEPNVAMDSANLFLVRLGKDASFTRYQKFATLLFANEWEAMLRGF